MSLTPASLTSRLVVTTVAAALLVSVLIGTVTTLAVRAFLTDQLDEDVQRSLQRVQMAPRFDRMPDGPVGRRPGDAVGSLTALSYSDYRYGWVTQQDSDGTVVEADLSDDALDRLAAVPQDGESHRVDVDGFGSYLVAVSDGGTTTVGLPTADVDDVVSNLIRWEVVLGTGAVLGAGAVATVVVRRQLRPLREVAATAHTVAALPLAEGEIDLAERVPEHLTDERTEVGQVGSALNTLLAHVEDSLTARHRSEMQVRQFVADASHELRTPLATIAGYTELARRRPDDAEAGSIALGKVEEESRRMTALVEDLLLLARLDSGRPLEREPVDLTRLLLEAVSDARVLAPEHHWRLDLPEESVEVVGDEQRLHQVVTNLLTNARKHTPAGTTVTVTARPGGFTVHDDGPGFPPELVDHAFERFARGDASRHREGGAGLGLALVQAIVSAHGGSVSLTSQPGDTRIAVRLP